MEFRWVAVIALWTLLSGPIFSPPSGGSSETSRKASASRTARALAHRPSTSIVR